MTTSPLLTGGAGFDFEDSVAAVYLTSLLLESGVLGLGQFTASRVALQRASSGAPLDDVIVTGVNASGESATLHLQVKSTLQIGDSPSNTDFRDVLTKAWSTVQGTSFKTGRDRVGAAVGTISQTRLRALRRLQEVAFEAGQTACLTAELLWNVLMRGDGFQWHFSGLLMTDKRLRWRKPSSNRPWRLQLLESPQTSAPLV